MKTTILFDLDGTLIDSTEAILEGFVTSFRQNGGEIPNEAKVLEVIGHPLDIMFKLLNCDEGRVDEYVKSYKEHYRKIATAKTILLPNAKEAVEEAASFARVGVVTTKTRAYSIDILEHLGVLSHFETVVGRECVTHPKPHPEPVLLALTRMECDKENCNKSDIFLIGDTVMDLDAALGANIDFVGVMGRYGDIKEFQKRCKVLKNDALGAVRFIKERKV